jgi:hypothetical protein
MYMCMYIDAYAYVYVHVYDTLTVGMNGRTCGGSNLSGATVRFLCCTLFAVCCTHALC